MMFNSHSELIEKAKDILMQKGYMENEIYEDFGFRDHRIDIVGWKKDRKIAVACGKWDREKLADLRDFFDEVVYLPYISRTSSIGPEAERGKTFRKPSLSRLAGLKLLLAKGNDVLFEMPLSMRDWSKAQLEDELASMENEFSRFSKLFDALSHETRLKMMKHIFEDEDQTMGFAEFMRDLELNPKLVWENARKLSEGGLLEKIEKGQYQCSDFGRVEFMMSLALRRLMEALEQFEPL